MKYTLKQFVLILLGMVAISYTSNAQFTRYIVKLKNKGFTVHTLANPATYLSPTAIARRTKYNIAIDSTDLPITQRYLDSIRAVPNVTVLNVSKWLNHVAIQTSSSAAITKINSFPFVHSTVGIAARMVPQLGSASSSVQFEEVQPNLHRSHINYGGGFNQINLHNGQYLHDKGFLGSGMNVALMDAGFATYLTNVGIDSLRINNQIKETWDFVANEASVNEDAAHGYYCLSIIAANKPGQLVGTAPKSNYYLYRTEDVGSEYPIEEQNWIAAAERADSLGVSVFSTSLGYIDFDNATLNYSYAQRNGNTAIMTQAGDLAAKKGILVCNSAGNNGNGSANFVDYKYVAVPADGDSVVAVGSVSAAGLVANSSAWGPNANGKVKPNLTSMGVATSFFNTNGTVSTGSGTSFACPNIAGLLTCLWQAFPELHNMEIVDATQQAAHLFNNPDGRYGYGIPNMKAAFVNGLKKVHTNTTTINQCAVSVLFKAKDFSEGSYVLERKMPGAASFDSVRNIPASAAPYSLKNYTFLDTLNGSNFGTVAYRIKHKLGTDTSFYYPNFNVNYTTVCTTTGIAQINVHGIKIAPNPVQNYLFVQAGTISSGKLIVTIFNRDGKLVYHSTINAAASSKLNLSHLSTGMYSVEIKQQKKKLYVGQLVKL